MDNIRQRIERLEKQKRVRKIATVVTPPNQNQNNDDIAALETRVTVLEGLINQPEGTYATGYIFTNLLGGLVVECVWPSYYINSVAYAAGTDTVTLSTADATNNRFDAIILTSSGLSKITGTPSATPEQPTVDPSTQLLVTYILVEANQTDLTTDDIPIYDEGSETTVTSNNGTLNTTSTAVSPVSDTYILALGSFNSTHYIDFTYGAAKSIAGNTQLSYYIWLISQFGNTTFLKWQFFLSGSPVSNIVSVQSGNHNFTRQTTAAWQLNVIPWGSFTFTSGTFDKIRVTFNGSNSDGFYMDFANINVGVGSSSPLQNFFKTVVVDGTPVVASQPNDTLIFSGGSNVTLSAVDKTITFAAAGGSGLKTGTASGTDTYTVTISGVSSYTTHDAYEIIFTNGNTGASTININSLGAKSLKKSVSTDLSSGDISAGQSFIIVYDGTNFQVIGIGGGGSLSGDDLDMVELAYLRGIYYMVNR